MDRHIANRDEPPPTTGLENAVKLYATHLLKPLPVDDQRFETLQGPRFCSGELSKSDYVAYLRAFELALERIYPIDAINSFMGQLGSEWLLRLTPVMEHYLGSFLLASACSDSSSLFALESRRGSIKVGGALCSELELTEVYRYCARQPSLAVAIFLLQSKLVDFAISQKIVLSSGAPRASELGAFIMQMADHIGSSPNF